MPGSSERGATMSCSSAPRTSTAPRLNWPPTKPGCRLMSIVRKCTSCRRISAAVSAFPSTISVALTQSRTTRPPSTSITNWISTVSWKRERRDRFMQSMTGAFYRTATSSAPARIAAMSGRAATNARIAPASWTRQISSTHARPFQVRRISSCATQSTSFSSSPRWWIDYGNGSIPGKIGRCWLLRSLGSGSMKD